MRRFLAGVMVVAASGAFAQRGAPVLASQRPSEPLTTETAVYMYVGGDRTVVARNAPAFLPPIWHISDDLAKVPKTAVVQGTVSRAETGRAIAAFAIEAARALETQSATSVCELIRTTQARWVAAGSKDEFARRWHAAAIATLLRTDCFSAIDAALTAALADFPTEPRFRLARLVAAELQMSGAFADEGRPSGRQLREAETRYKLAAAFPSVSADAALHWARINALLGQHENAVRLAAEAGASRDSRIQYLAHLFRGWSLASLGKLDEADGEYARALSIVPDAQTAMLARAAAAFRGRDVERAYQIVNALASRPEPAEDPWWTYAIGDGRLVDSLIAQLREAIR